MYTTRSDTSANAITSDQTAVRRFLRDHGEVTSKDAFGTGTAVFEITFKNQVFLILLLDVADSLYHIPNVSLVNS